VTSASRSATACKLSDSAPIGAFSAVILSLSVLIAGFVSGLLPSDREAHDTRSLRRKPQTEGQAGRQGETRHPVLLFVAVRRSANSPAPLTRHLLHSSDKMSRPAPLSDLIEYHPFCGIRNLPEGGNMAPILLKRCIDTSYIDSEVVTPYKTISNCSHQRVPGTHSNPAPSTSWHLGTHLVRMPGRRHPCGRDVGGEKPGMVSGYPARTRTGATLGFTVVAAENWRRVLNKKPGSMPGFRVRGFPACSNQRRPPGRFTHHAL